MSETATQHTGIPSPSLSQKERKLDGWREIQLGEIVKSNRQSIGKGYPHTIIRYLDTGSISEGKIERFQEYTLSEAPSRAKRLVKDGDIVYSNVRPTQRHYGFIKNPSDNLVVSTGFSVIETDQSEADPLFIYHLLTSNNVVEELDIIAEGATSAYPSLRPSDIENLEILLPPLPEQKAIAEVLSSLDDKIDLLHRQNKTLEDMAQALFREWFVEGADKGWEEKSLGEVVDISIGRTPPRKEFKWFSKRPEDIKWISIKDMGDSGVYIFDTSEYLTKEAVRKFNIPTIPRNTVILSFKMTVGRVGITTEKMLSNEAIAQFKFNTKTPFSKEYLYLYLRTFKFDSLGSTSSIVTSINSSMIKEMLIAMPDYETMNKFQETSEQLFKRIFFNQSQIRTLENLRDTLLPKLMSGAVRVRFWE